MASQLIEQVTAHAQGDSLEDARDICADGTYYSNNLCNNLDTHRDQKQSITQTHPADTHEQCDTHNVTRTM
jgi:hypothetical protein